MMGSSPSGRFVDVSCDLLARGYGVRFRAAGGSMRPAVCDGDVITVVPATRPSLDTGNVILYRRDGRLFAHRVVSAAGDGGAFREVVLRGDALPACDPPVDASQVVGELVSVDRAARRSLTERLMSSTRRGVRRAARPARTLAFAAVSLLLCAIPRAQAAILQQVQSGTAVNSANGTQTITIASVDITKSFLVFQTRSSGDRPVNTTVGGRLASSTTIEFERSTNEGSPAAINIQWYVATFGSGVTVQRGSATMSATTVDVAITPVSSMSQAFVLWSMTPNNTEVDHDGDDAITGDLTSTSNLQFRTGTASSHLVYWQVIEFTSAADINVQRGTVSSMTGTALTANATLPTPVAGGSTFLLTSFRTTGTGSDIGARLLRAQLVNPTTLTFDRSISGSPDDITEIAWQAVELKDGSSVQFGTANFPSGTAQVTTGIGVHTNLTRAIAFSAVQVGGQSMGRSSYSGNDVPGVASFTTSLSASQITLDRNSTVAAADVGWFVVQFAGGTGFKVGSFTKSGGTAPASQAIQHGLGEKPKALILWTEAQTNEAFSTTPSITFKGATTGSAPSGTLTLTINVPPATALNDVLIASVAVRPDTAVVTPPAGWSVVRRIDQTTGSRNSLIIYGKAATASEPASYSWTFDTSTGSAGGIQGFAGVDLANALDIDLGAATASGLTHAAPSVTTTSANDVIITTHAFSSGATWSTPTGMTEAFDVSSNTVPDALGISVQGSYVMQAAAGASGAKSATASNDADTGTTHTLALRAAPAAGAAYFGFGMTDGTTSRSVSTSSRDGQNFANASTRMASKALTLVSWGETVVAEADLQSWNETSFTLNWTTNDTAAYVIHYIAIGGSDVSAKVVDWTMRTTTGARNVAGVGFQPDVVFHAHGGHTFTGALNTNLAGGGFGLGVMDFDGDEWAFANFTSDGVGTSATARGQRTDASIYSFNATPTVQKTADFTSMDADGFTLNFSNTGSNLAARVFSLALKGVNVKAGFFTKTSSATPVTQPITGVGFKPSVVLLGSVQSTASATPAVHSRFGLGASDGTVEGSSAVQDTDALGTSSVDAIDKTSKVFVKVNNNTPAIDAEADLTAFGADGFTLDWTTNDAVLTQILYLSLAPLAVTEARLTSFTAARDARGVQLAWHTGYEVNNLGFHVYREIDGRRERLTRSLVAGSGLTVGSRSRATNAQSYTYWDLDPRAASPAAVYWLEDVDFNGKGTWHGPVAPVVLATTAAETPDENSRSLDGLGRGAGHSSERFLTSIDPLRETGAALAVGQSPSLVQRAATAPDSRLAQWAIAGGAAVKIGVRAPGWYRVTQPSLVAAGLDPDVDPATLHLYLEGVEQPIAITGAADGRFDAGDAIEFYGTGTDTPATDIAVYWLTGGTAGAGAGLRVQPAPAAAPGASAPARFWGTVEHKDRSIYFAALRNGEAENWFGALIANGEPAEVAVTVRHPDAAAPSEAVLEAILQGVTATPDPAGHQVRVLVNGTAVGEVTFRDRAQGAATLAVPHNLLVEGSNVVRFEALGGDADITLFDTVRLSYWHSMDADGDALTLSAGAQQQVTINGFAAGAVRVIDITDAQQMFELGVAAGPGPSSVITQAPGTGTRSLLAFTDAAVASPVFVTANQPSSLHDAANAYDYLVVTHPDFAAQAASLVAHRASQGHRAALVSIDDVYDEFSFGARTPDALRDFLTLARSAWVVAPRYVVLAGDATFDPRDYAGFGPGDFVPTKLVDMTQLDLETASDDWFVDVNLDGVPEVAIGRLPVRTPAQAATIVAKLTAYDAEPGGAWARSVALVTDSDDAVTHFRLSSAHVESRLPGAYVPQRLDADVLGAAALKGQLFDLVAQGQLIVNYLGHGSERIWGSSGELLDVGDIGAGWAAAGSRLPFVIAMNCLNGSFQNIYAEGSLAETLLRADGGAIGVWASSSLTDAEPQGVMNDELFRLVFNQSQVALGDALRAAKQAVADVDVRRSWTFFGDPAMRLKDVALPVTPPAALPTLTATPSSVNFGVIPSGASFSAATTTQSIRLVQSGAGTVTWTATADQPWIQIANGSGTGSGRFSVAIAADGLPSAGAATGTITIAASGAQASPSVTVRVTVLTQGASNAPFGSLDTPAPGATVSGAMAVTGWALDDVQVASVQIFRDPVGAEAPGLKYVGDALLIPGARPDIEAAYPLLPLNARAGWGYMLLTNMLPLQGNGSYTVHALATDNEGGRAWLGTRTFTSDNAHAIKPFGTIDTPSPSTIASGSAFLNFGWTLAPQGKTVPFDGSTIAVLVDGVMVGRPGSLAARADIQALFPGYANTDHAVGGFFLDTTAHADGVHTLAWIVTDSDGVSEGIGSRFFTIDNAVAAPVTAPLRAESESLAVDAGAPVHARRGYARTAPLELVAARDGTRQVLAREVERVEVHLAGEGDAADGWRYAGYQLVNGDRRALPVGSTLDPASGRFSWDPGPGFIGGYKLLFVRTAAAGRSEQIPVDVILRPRHRGASRIEMAIDRPLPGEVRSSFLVSGRAYDRGARAGGVDAVNLWAYPEPGSGASPIFLGSAGVVNGAFDFRVSGLGAGRYAVAVAPHSTVSGQFETAEVVTVVVR